MSSPPDGAGKLAGERIQKVLARAGVASRRAVEEMVRAGRVTVNGSPALIGARVDPTMDQVEVDGRPLNAGPERMRYLLLNKPRGVVSTMSDPQGRRTVANLLPDMDQRLYPVGRLDFGSEGLILFTNDGDLTNALLHPRHEVWKTYEVEVEGNPKAHELRLLERGVDLDGRRTMPAEFRALGPGQTDGATALEVRLREGRKQQIRRMLGDAGYPVISLRRTAFGPLADGSLAPGAWRELEAHEVADLKSAALA